MKQRITLTAAAALALSVLAFADLLPAGASYDAYAADGTTHIGTLDVSSSGNLLTYNDDPSTSHPPDTSGSYAKDNAGTGYGDGQGHTVYFTHEGAGEYSWVKKKNSTGEIVDSGSIIPVP